jgi:hypothetical protein
MKPEGSLPHSQVLATCLYPEPDQSSPYPTSHFLKTHLNIILPSLPRSHQRPLSLSFPHQNPVHGSPLPGKRYMHRPSHSSGFYHPHNTGRAVHIIKLLIMKFSPLPCYLVTPITLFSNTLSPCSSLTVSDQVSHPYQTGEITYFTQKTKLVLSATGSKTSCPKHAHCYFF